MTVRKEKQREKEKARTGKRDRTAMTMCWSNRENVIPAEHRIKSCVQHAVCDTGLQLQGEDDVENGR
jgi:hypothetical protein